MRDSTIIRSMLMLPVAVLAFIAAYALDGRDLAFFFVGCGVYAILSALFNVVLMLGRHAQRPLQERAVQTRANRGRS